MGEKLDALEPFHPDRMASRILGMGDVLTLIEKAQVGVDAKKAAEMERKLRQNEFTLDDFLDQLQQMKSMGPISQIMDMMPGMGKIKGLQGLELSDKDIKRTEAIVLSMTKEERRKPDIMNGSRRKRVALGSGTSVQAVNKLLKQYEQSMKMMKQFSQMQNPAKGGKKGGMNFPFTR
jgi:signal recognition particle subunit SRP54